jgi:toxin ParE1/3/4
MRKVCLRPRAWQDVRQTAIYLGAEAGEAVADRFQDSLQSLLNTLAKSPGIGARWSFRDPRLKDVRRLPLTGFESWLVFYQASKMRIDVIRVLHGARDIATVLEDGE